MGSHRVESRRQQGMVVENPEASADDGLTIASGVPGESNSGTNVLVITRNALHNAEGVLCSGIDGGCGREERADFHVVAHTVVDGQVFVQNPVVLREKANRDIVEGTVGISDALNVGGWNSQAVGLEASRTGKCDFSGSAGTIVRPGSGVNTIWERKSGSGKSAKIDVAPEIKFKNLRL